MGGEARVDTIIPTFQMRKLLSLGRLNPVSSVAKQVYLSEGSDFQLLTLNLLVLGSLKYFECLFLTRLLSLHRADLMKRFALQQSLKLLFFYNIESFPFLLQTDVLFFIRRLGCSLFKESEQCRGAQRSLTCGLP